MCKERTLQRKIEKQLEKAAVFFDFHIAVISGHNFLNALLLRFLLSGEDRDAPEQTDERQHRDQ